MLASCRAFEAPRQRVLIVGIDGASPRVLDTMFSMGKLENLKALADAGTYGPLRSETPYLLSPRVWTTVATGMIPDKHLIDGWVKVAKDGTAGLFYSSDRRGHALWNIVSDSGKRVAVVNWLVTYPPEKVNGIIVSDHTLPGEVEGKKYIGEIFAKGRGAEFRGVESAGSGTSPIYPEEWKKAVLDSRHEKAVLTKVASPFREGAAIGFDPFLHNLRDFWNTDQRLASITLEILERERPDVTMVLLQGIDRMSHFLFGCLDDPAKYPPTFQPTPEQRINCQSALYDYYEFSDQLIGRLLESFDDDDLIMVLSDHGFESGFSEFRTGDHSTEAAQDGICVVRGPRVIKHGPVAPMTVADVTPTVLAWMGLAQALDMDGKPAPFLEPGPAIQSVPTYDTKPIERLGDGKSGAEPQVIEQLRSLGYIE